MHQLPSLPAYTKIASVKTSIEHHLGLLSETYYLTYLDTAPLENCKTLLELDAIDGCTFELRTWRLWGDLVDACHCNSTDRCLEYPGIRGTTDWNKRCAWSALFMAAHRGHHIMVSNILERTSVDVNRQSQCTGWSPLHAAARAGMWKALCVLINHSADVKIADGKGVTAFDLAREFGNKRCEDTLGFCQWSLQKHSLVQERKSDYSAAKAREIASRQGHQFRDSTLKNWLGGPRGQLYMSQIPNPVSLREVAQFGVDLRTKNLASAAPMEHASSRAREPATGTEEPSIVDEGDKERQIDRSKTTVDEGDEERQIDRSKTKFDYGWFDPLRAHYFIPSTNDVLTYTDPSSLQLRPRSILNPNGYKAARLTKSYRSPPPLHPTGR